MSGGFDPTGLPARGGLGSVLIGTAGWGIPRALAARFPAEGSLLARYGQVFSAVEINTSFYRPHRPQTYARWAESVPDDFRFAVKLPRAITHERRLVDADGLLDRFLGEAGALGDKLGPVLVQLPPSLPWRESVARPFFAALRERFAGPIVCEPRHRAWFSEEAEAALAEFGIARVAADPPPAPGAGEPGGAPRPRYWRLHGSPEMYKSAYSPAFLDALAQRLGPEAARGVPVWCIFDNTALGAAAADALALIDRLASRPSA